MSAFYSGTDNASDRLSINYSMVIGNLKPDSYSYVIRFNLFDHKIGAKLEEVFLEGQEVNFVVPQEWLDKIQVPAPVVHKARVFNAGRDLSLRGKGLGYKYPEPDANAAFWDNLSFDRIGSWMDEIDEKVDLETGEITYGRYHSSRKSPKKSNSDSPDDADYGNNYYQALYGEEEGEAIEQISIYLEDLTENEDAVVDVIRQAYAMLSDKGRSDLANNGF